MENENNPPINRALGNTGNIAQGDFLRVLCVCSAGLLRSPTTALVLSLAPFNFNTRSCGIEPSYALIPISETLLHWAEVVVCADNEHSQQVDLMVNRYIGRWRIEDPDKYWPEVYCLDLPDIYNYKDDTLVGIITKKCLDIFGKEYGVVSPKV